MSPTREETDHWFGHPDYIGKPERDVAPRLEACPACGFQLNLTRPTFSCPDCGAQLKEG